MPICSNCTTKVRGRALAAYAGQAVASAAAPKAKAKSTSGAKPKPRATVTPAEPLHKTQNGSSRSGGEGGLTEQNVALTVRIEINLPATGDQDTYDRIFKSIVRIY